MSYAEFPCLHDAIGMKDSMSAKQVQRSMVPVVIFEVKHDEIRPAFTHRLL